MPRPTRAALGLRPSASLASALAPAGLQEDARAQNAVRVLTDIQAIPESAIPDKLFDEARAVIVIPDAMKLGLVVGGRRGHGLLSVRPRTAPGRTRPSSPSPAAASACRRACSRRTSCWCSAATAAGFHRQRQVHPRRRCRRRRRPGRAQRQRRHRRRDEGGNLVVVARAACSPASPSTARCQHRRCRGRIGVRPRHHAADDLRIAHAAAAFQRRGRVPRRAGGSHRHRARALRRRWRVTRRHGGPGRRARGAGQHRRRPRPARPWPNRCPTPPAAGALTPAVNCLPRRIFRRNASWAV